MIKNNLIKDFLVVFSIFLLDRISKIYVIYLDGKLNGEEIYLSKFLNIQLVWNEGIAFGLFSFNNSDFYDILSLIIAGVILVLLIMAFKNNGFKKYSLLMIIGGALGNLHDRIMFSAVTDFIDFHIGNFHWFIFNVSDIFISLGVLFLIIFEIIDNQKNKIDEKNI